MSGLLVACGRLREVDGDTVTMGDGERPGRSMNADSVLLLAQGWVLRGIEAQFVRLLPRRDDHCVVAHAPQQPAVDAIALLHPSSLRLLWRPQQRLLLPGVDSHAGQPDVRRAYPG